MAFRTFFSFRWSALTGVALSLAILTGCSSCGTANYLLQAARGQFEISNRARPLPEVIADEKTPPKIRDLLKEIAGVKAFGEKHGIRSTRNYETYVDLKRSAASYVVSASLPLKFESKEWSFPFVGKFPYLGWFDLAQARSYAEELKTENWDVDLRGAGAFSTLGWFRDPVLSTMIPEGDNALGELVDVVLHESVHATIYVKGQAPFNESLAMFVARGLTESYFREFYPREPRWLDAYLEDERLSAERQEKMHAAFLKLDELYRSSAEDTAKTARKKEIISQLEKDIGAKRSLNNATLIQFRTYHAGKNRFGDLFAALGNSWPRFMTCVVRTQEEWFSGSQAEDFSAVIARLRDECN